MMFALRTPITRLGRSSILSQCRCYATPPTPPLVSKLRVDLKDAMRAKDSARLAVLRGVLAEITNASKTANPPTTDVHILALINKLSARSQSSAQEFRAAGREELAEKEEAQVKVLDSYAEQVETVGKDKIVGAVSKAIEGGAKEMGSVMKEVLKALEGLPVVKAEVAAVVKEVLSGDAGRK